MTSNRSEQGVLHNTVGIKKVVAEALAGCMMNGLLLHLNSPSKSNMSHNNVLYSPNVSSYSPSIKLISEVDCFYTVHQFVVTRAMLITINKRIQVIIIIITIFLTEV